MNIFDNSTHKFLFYFLFFSIIVLLFIFKSRLEYHKAKAHIMKESSSRIASDKDFIYCIINYIINSSFIKDLLDSGTYSSFDLFYDIVKESLISQFKNDYDLHIEFIPNTTLENPLTYLYRFPYFNTFDSKLNVFKEAINSLEIENELLRMYSSKFEEGIKEAEEIEKEAIAYHKTFGNEPSGDPKLHPRDNSYDSENISDTEESVNEDELFDKLLSSGTVEEFEDNNLKEF